MTLATAVLVSGCGSMVRPSAVGPTILVVPSPSAATVTVTASPTPSKKPERPQPVKTVTVSSQPTVTVIEPPQTSEYLVWLCQSRAYELPAIAPGESSPKWKLLQWSLKQLGHYEADIGGNYREQIFNAIHRFQLNVGLGEAGNVASNTWMQLQLPLC